MAHSSEQEEDGEVEEEGEKDTRGVLPTVDKDEDLIGERGAGEAVKNRRSAGEIERNGSPRIGTEQKGAQ